MIIFIAEIIVLILFAVNVLFALNVQKKFIASCNGEYKMFKDANLQKFIVIFFVILIISLYFAIFQKKYIFVLAAILMLFLVVGSIKNAMIIGKDKMYFRECAVPLTEIKSAELTLTGKGKFMILFYMQNDHKFGYAHAKIDSPKAIYDYIEQIGIPVENTLNKKATKEDIKEEDRIDLVDEDDTTNN